MSGSNKISRATVTLLVSGYLAVGGTEAKTDIGQAATCLAPTPQIAMAYDSVLALDANGKIFSWGDRYALQSAAGTSISGYQSSDADYFLNQALADPDNLTDATTLNELTVVDIGYGFGTRLLLTDSGLLIGWGDEVYGSLGNGTANEDITVPTVVADSAAFAGEQVVDIVVNNRSTLALTEAGNLYAWGQHISSADSPQLIGIPESAGEIASVHAPRDYQTFLMLSKNGNIYEFDGNPVPKTSGVSAVKRADDSANANFVEIHANPASESGVPANYGTAAYWLAKDSDGNLWGKSENSSNSTENKQMGFNGNLPTTLSQITFEGDLGTAIDNGATVSKVFPGINATAVIDDAGNLYILADGDAPIPANGQMSNVTESSEYNNIFLPSASAVYSYKYGTNEGIPAGVKILTASIGAVTMAVGDDGKVYTWGPEGSATNGLANAAVYAARGGVNLQEETAHEIDFTANGTQPDFISTAFSSACDPTPVASPTPPPYTGPIIKGVVAGGNNEFTASGNETATFEGERLGSVTEAYVDEKNAEVLDTQEDQFTIEIPQGLNPGVYDLDIRSSSGNLTFLDAITITSAPEPVSYGQANSWTSRIYDTQVKVYVKFPTVGEKVRIGHQTGGAGSYETVYVKTTSSETMEGLRIVEGVGTYIVRTIDLASINRIRVTVGDEVMVQVRYSN